MRKKPPKVSNFREQISPVKSYQYALFLGKIMNLPVLNAFLSITIPNLQRVLVQAQSVKSVPRKIN
jgi:hypothetical protein